jgi:quercetin dioxygenase-like cupin family protein
MVDERSRSKESEPEPVVRYEEVFTHMNNVQDRVENPYAVRSGEVPWENSRQGKLKYYSMIEMENVPIPDMMTFRHEIPDESGRHTHQGGLALFATKGQGATLVDDERVPWEAGDLVLLPVKPGGVTHQHFNRNGPDNPAEWLAIFYMPELEQLGAELTQDSVSKEWEGHGDAMGGLDEGHSHDHDGKRINTEFSDFDYQDWADYEEPDAVDSFYDDLIRRRNRHRKSMAEAQNAGNWAIIKNDQPDWEWNPQGKIKWYLHPMYDQIGDARSMKNQLYSVQEIPPGSRSGKQIRQGGVAHYILEGEGHSVIDGKKFEWSENDYLGLPVKPDGLTVQHFNDDPSNPARFIRCEINKFSTFGYDMGCGFKQLEACPEYEGELPQ